MRRVYWDIFVFRETENELFLLLGASSTTHLLFFFTDENLIFRDSTIEECRKKIAACYQKGLGQKIDMRK